MAIALAFNPPQFIDQYEGYKMRQLVDELERLHAALTRDVDEEGVSGSVDSFNGRVGTVVPLQADYDAFFLTPAEGNAAYSLLGHTHAASEIVSGSFDDARISQTSVTQHQAALSITESQISDLGAYLTDIVLDTTPQLGANLDMNSFDLTGVGDINITGTIGSTGRIYSSYLPGPSSHTDGTIVAGGNQPVIVIVDENGPANNRAVGLKQSGTSFTMSLMSDIGAFGEDIINISRSGNAVTVFNVGGGRFEHIGGDGFDIRDGSTFRIYESGDFGNAAFRHDGVDFNTTFSSTTEWNIGITLNVTGGGTFSGAVTGSNLNIANWNTAFGWGDHSVQNYALTTGDTFTGQVNFQNSGGGLIRIYENSLVEYSQLLEVGSALYITNSAAAGEIQLQPGSGGVRVMDSTFAITDSSLNNALVMDRDLNDLTFVFQNATRDWVVSGLTGQISFQNNLSVTGALTATSYGGITEANLVDKSATETIAGTWSFNNSVTAGGFHLNDSATFTLGTSNDASIYFDGAAEVLYVDLSATSDFFLRHGIDTAITAIANGAVSLAYDNADKLATTATGIDVTGRIVGDGLDVLTGNTLRIYDSLDTSVATISRTGTTFEIDLDVATDSFIFRTAGASRMQIVGQTSIELQNNTNVSGKLSVPASTTSSANLILPHGVAPTTPVNGDVWTTTAGMYVRINGATVGPLGSAGASALNDLSDVVITAAASGEFLRHNGTNWVDSTIQNADISAAMVTQHVGSIDHDALLNFVANEHIDWTNATQHFLTSGYVQVHRSGGLAKDMLWLRDTTDTQDLVFYYDGGWWEVRSEAGGVGTRWMKFDSGQLVVFDGNVDVGAGLDVTGNITVTGTVDGVDIAARDHDAVTLVGTPDYITLSGQVLTRGLVDLSTDVTGSLPAASIASGNLGSGVLPYATASAAASAFTIPFMNTTGVASGNFAILIDSATPPTYNPSTGTMTATAFSGSGASLTSIPETAITDGSILARIAAAENISGAWNFTAGLDVNTGSALRVYDGSNTDYIEITHDGVNPAIECDTLSTTINVGNASNITSVTLAYAGSLRQNNVSAAPADTTNYGQWWNQNFTPNVARFTDETGIDYSLQNIHEWEMQYSSTTTAGDPGAGTVRFNSITIGSITTMYIDDLLITGADNDWILSNLASGDVLSIRSMSDPTKYIVAKVNGAPTDGTGYWTVPLTLVHTGVIFTNGELLMFSVNWLSQVAAGSQTPWVQDVDAATFDLTIGNMFFDNSGNSFRLSNGTDMLTMQQQTDITQFSFTGVNTFQLSNLAAGMIIQDGAYLRINDSLDTDYGQFSHDGIDFNTTFFQTAAWNIDGPVQIGSTSHGVNQRTLTVYDDASAGVVAAFESNSASYSLVDIDNTNAAPTNGAQLRFLQAGAVKATFGFQPAYSATAHLGVMSGHTASPAHVFYVDGTGYYMRGGSFRQYDAGLTDYAQFSHNGVDYNTTFAGTTQWNIGVGLNVTGGVTATSFSGDGSGLTLISANSISPGNFATGVLYYTTAVAAASNYAVPFLNTTGVASGNFASYIDSGGGFTYNPSTDTLVAGTFSGSHSGSGASLTSLTAANISAGSLASGVNPYFTASAGNFAYKVPFMNYTGTASTNAGLLHDSSASLTYNPSTDTLVAGVFSGSGASLTSIPETAITDGSVLARVAGNETITGDWTWTTFAPAMRFGLVGDYDATGGSASWGATIWSLDSTYKGGTAGTDSASTSVYGLRWLRSNHAGATTAIQEGVYVFNNGSIVGGIGSGGMQSNGSIHIEEQASADVDIANFGQLWVLNQTPNYLMFTDDAGTDKYVGMGQYTLIANQTFDMNTAGNAEKCPNGAWYSDNATAYTLTLENSTGTDFPVGSQMTIWNEGAGTLTINEGTTTTLYLMTGSAVTDTAGGCTMAQGGYATLIRKSSSVYLIMGAGLTA